MVLSISTFVKEFNSEKRMRCVVSIFFFFPYPYNDWDIEIPNTKLINQIQ